MTKFRCQTSHVLTLLLVSIFLGCDGNEEGDPQDNNHIVTGIVTDQETNEPVGGASVYLGGQLFGEIDRGMTTFEQVSAVSAIDGSFILIIPASYMEIRDYVLQIFAHKTGYAGSSYMPPPENGKLSESLRLYHKAELQLHVKNDTVADVTDTIDVGLWGSYEFMSYPGFTGIFYSTLMRPRIILKCGGRVFDTIFRFPDLWGNLEYSVGVRSSNYFFEPVYKVTPAPDTITCFEVIF